ncbi:MAG: class I SAM-dependent methyltransferase [Bacteroidota bacterium]
MPPVYDAARAAGYDAHIRRISPGYEVLHDHIAGLLLGALEPEAHILVVGAGTGAEVERLGRAAPGWRFTAVDPSPDMLAVCRQRAEAAGMADRVAYVEGTTEAAPDGPFDAATSVCVAHFLLDPEARVHYFQAIADRLGPGAPFVHADLFRPTGDPEAIERLITVWRRAVRQAGMSDPEADAFFDRVGRMVHLADEATLDREATAAGFGRRTRFHQSLLWGAWIATRPPKAGRSEEAR